MRFKHLNATNLKFALDLHPNSTTVIQALKLYDGNDYENLEELLRLTSQILSDNPIFFLLNTYTAGMSSTVLNYMVEEYIAKGRGSVTTDEIGLKVTKRPLIMPAGNTTVWKMD